MTRASHNSIPIFIVATASDLERFKLNQLEAWIKVSTI